VFRPWLRVGKPDDWTGAVAQAVVTLVSLFLLVIVVLAKMPESWVFVAFDNHFVVRTVLAFLLLYGIGWLRALAFAGLPASIVLLGGTLRFRRNGRAVQLQIKEIAHARIEQRPRPVGEMLVVEMRNGMTYELCPVHWEGAERIFSKVSGFVALNNFRAAAVASRLKSREARGTGGPGVGEGHSSVLSKPTARQPVDKKSAGTDAPKDD